MIFRVVTLIVMSWTISAAAETLHAVGSSTLLPVVSEAAKHYHRIHPDVTITVSGGGSGVGVAAMISGSADFGMTSRELRTEEEQRLKDRIELVTIAHDAVAVMVSKPVFMAGVRALTLEQIAAIYRGRIRNWKGVGGPDRPILVIDKEAGRGTRHVFAKAVLGDAGARAPGAVVVAGSNNEMQALVGRSDSAIGILSSAWGSDSVRALAIRTRQGEISPTPDNIVSGRYPIGRKLVLLLPRNASASARDFVAFLLSPEGQAIVEEVGYVPIQ